MKKRIVFSLLFLILIVNILSVSAGIRHPGGDFKIRVESSDETLDTMTTEEFMGTSSYSDISKDNPGHSASEIWVTVGSKENTLLAALNSGKNGLCPGKSSVTNSDNPLGVYHLASEIELSSGKILQQAIDGEEFCAPEYSYSWKTGSWSSCSVDCGGGTQTRDVWCERSDGTRVSDSYCSGTKPATSRSCNTQSCPEPEPETCSGVVCKPDETCQEFLVWHRVENLGCTMIFRSCDNPAYWEGASCSKEGETTTCGEEPTCSLFTSTTYKLRCEVELFCA